MSAAEDQVRWGLDYIRRTYGQGTMMSAKPKRYPVAPKAQAAGLAGTVAGIIIWILQTYAFKGNDVPAGLVSLIYAAVPGVSALAAAYFAPHQARPGDTPAQVPLRAAESPAEATPAVSPSQEPPAV